MQRIPKILKFAVVIQSRGPSPSKLQPPQKSDLFFGNVTAQRSILQELLQRRIHYVVRFFFHELKPLDSSRRQPAVQHDLESECLEINVPRVDHGVEKRYPVLNRYVEHVRVQEFKNRHAHFL